METRAVTIRGHKFTVETGTTPNDEIHWGWINKGTWEVDTFDHISRHTTKDTFFVDIGAHIGMVSLYASSLAHHVVSVEPDEVALKALKSNIALNKIENIEVIEKAIADGGKLTLYSASLGNSMSNLLGTGTNKREIDTISLDEILDKSQGCKNIFVKIDIEGFEEKIAGQIALISKRDNVALLLSLHKNLKHVSKDYISTVANALEGFTHFECAGKKVDLEWIRQSGYDQAVLCTKI